MLCPPRSPLPGPRPLSASLSSRGVHFCGSVGGPRPLRALRPVPASPVCRPGGSWWACAFVLPMGPRVETHVLSWVVTPCSGPTLHTEVWFRPRGKAWSWPWGPGEPNSCWRETPACPHTLPAPAPCPCQPGSGVRQSRLCRAGRAKCKKGRKGRATRGQQGPLPGPREPLRPGCGPRGCLGPPRGRGLHFSLFCTHVQEMSFFLLLFWTASRKAGPVGGEAAWGPGVALELPSLPRAVPSPEKRQATPQLHPRPQGPEA